MLTASPPHAVYRENTLEALRVLVQQPAVRRQLEAHRDVCAKVLDCDLDPLHPVLARLYAPTGRPGRDPCTLFRALLLMNWRGFTELEPWVVELRASPLWAVLCGFDPDRAPGASTFRDFLRRLSRSWPSRPRIRRRRRRAKDRAATRKGQKLPERHPDVLARLLAWLPRRPTQDDPLNEILALFARASAGRGWIHPHALHVAGDGTPLESFTDHEGKRCCPHPPGTDCRCRRRFPDPDAAWGWDSHHERWFWGYHVYELTACNGPHDLPLYLQRAAANRNDAVSFVPAYLGLRRLYPDWHLQALILDAGHDSEPLYVRLRSDGVLALIDLNPRTKGEQPPLDPAHPPMDRAGTPICPAGHFLAPNGTSRGRGVWVCPALRARSGIRCEAPCKRHRVYTTAASFLRAFPGVLRGSPQWKDLYAQRTAVERSHKRKLRDFHHEFGRTRRAAYRIGLYFFAAYCQHVDAWFAGPNLPAHLQGVMSALQAA